MMKKVIALLLILALVLTVGCAGKPATKPGPATKVGVEATPSAPVSTASAVSDVDADLADIDNLEKDLENTDLDSLDTELDIQI
jgi:PBP1b-binding outer membrane lipoprotein LpoB